MTNDSNETLHSFLESFDRLNARAIEAGKREAEVPWWRFREQRHRMRDWQLAGRRADAAMGLCQIAAGFIPEDRETNDEG